MGRCEAVGILVIDAANVIGSRPTGWWRDRPGATQRFTERVRATVVAGRLEPPVTLVLEGQARAGVDEAEVDGVEVVHAPGEGDDTITAIAEAHRGVIVVTADRGLAERVRAAKAEVVGPSWLLDQLVDTRSVLEPSEQNADSGALQNGAASRDRRRRDADDATVSQSGPRVLQPSDAYSCRPSWRKKVAESK